MLEPRVLLSALLDTGIDYSVALGPAAVAVGDIANAGALDLVVAASLDAAFSVLFNAGDGSYETVIDYDIDSPANAVALADLDGDGDLDLALSLFDLNIVGLMENLGDGSFAWYGDVATGTGPSDIAAGDLDHDGVVDIVVTNAQDTTVTVIGWDLAPIDYEIGQGPESVTLADLDGDGFLDVIATRPGSLEEPTNIVAVLTNRGDGSFSDPTEITVSSGPFSVTSADFDRDGDADLAVTSIDDAAVDVLLNDGAGTLTLTASLPVVASPNAITSADLNRDGMPDLITTSSGSNVVSVLLSLGNVGFADAITFQTGDDPLALATGDLDASGSPDIVTANFTADSVTVMLNTTAVGPGVVFSISGQNASGKQIVYQLATDDAWRAVDLIASAGGPAVTDVVTWTDPKDDRQYAAGSSHTGLILYTNVAGGTWTIRNLSLEQTDARPIVGQLQVMTSPAGLINITGLDDNGDLIRYAQDGTTITTGRYRWDATNLGQHLRDRGQQMPGFTGPLVSYTTRWGALNVVGLDEFGSIWAVWWAPGRTGWSANNLSEMYGTSPISGGLTVFLTPWDGMNIAGIDDAGHLQVTWWIPAFRGIGWKHSDMTAEFDGPLLAPASVSSFVSSWGGMNVAGIDQDTGEVMVYWWSPERRGIGWAVASLTQTVGLDQPRISQVLIGLAPRDSSLNVFGLDDEGDMIRYFWMPGQPWSAQNLTDIAIPG
jgi:hypothetical protein